MKNVLSFLLIFICSYTLGQSVKEATINTEVRSVTVFLDGAQITRQARTYLSKGSTKLVIKELSPFLDPQSIQVKLDNSITILSVNHQIDFLKEHEKSTIENKIETIEDSLEYEKVLLSTLEAEEVMLKANQAIGGRDTGYKLTDLQEITTYYADRLRELKVYSLSKKKLIHNYEKTLEQLRSQLIEFNANQKLNTSNIILTVSSDNPTSAQIELSYLTKNAGWYPNYDLRVKDIDNPIELVYKANVYQNTGEDWKNVALTFSNADPNQSGVVPALNPYYLSFNQRIAENTLMGRIAGVQINNNIHNVSGKVVDAETGEPIPGVNIIAKGTTVGTITDIDGNYTLTIPADATLLAFSFIGYQAQSIPITNSVLNVVLTPDIQQLNEVVVVGYAQGVAKDKKVKREAPSVTNSIPTTQIEHQTNIEFQVDIPYSIASDGENYMVDLASYSIPALYEYQCVPKIDNDAFLIAKITDWDQYNLLEGEANLFFEGTYVGRSLLDVRYVSDTLDISLGRDKNVLVKREKIKDFNKKQWIGANRIESRSWNITIRNNKSQKINLILKDQIPVSTTSEIEISSMEFGNGKLDKEKGIITWNLKLEPKLQKELSLQYAVKYSKSRNLIIE